jgi:integrase
MRITRTGTIGANMAGKSGHRSWGWLRKLPSGRWQASYLGDDGRRHTAPRTFTAKIDAEGWLAAERRLLERDSWTPPGVRKAQKKAAVLTLADYAAQWIKHRPLKPRTRIEYTGLAHRLITGSPIGEAALADLTPEAVRMWYSGLGTTTPTRNSHAYGLLHAVLKTAVKDGLLQSNPAQIERAMNPRTVREPVILTVSEVAELAEKIEPNYRALVLIAAWCGLRWGEVIELRRKDIRSGCETISVSRAATHRGACRIDTPKSGKGRKVAVPPHIKGAIEAHLANYVAAESESLLFTTERKACHLNDSVFMRSAFKPALKSIGREGVRIHELRHFAGTMAARHGNLVEVMNRLGHSTPKASLIYQQMVNGRDAELADALSVEARRSNRADRL